MHLAPPANMEAFDHRARAALARLEELRPKYNEERTLSGKLGDKPIFTDRVAGSKEDQGLVEKLIGRGFAERGARAVSPASSTESSARLARVTGIFNKKIVYIEGLGASGLFRHQI
jgi:hypothetical protein